MRTYAKEETQAGSTANGYDYRNQAWVVDGKYVACGHGKPCDCFGTVHAGQRGGGEGVATCWESETEQQAVDEMFRHMRVDRQFRFLGSNGFIIPTGKEDDYMLFNGGKA